jgi:site-specific recombinase XerD
LKQFISWLAVPIEQASRQDVKLYVDFLLEKDMKARSINCHISVVRCFYDYLRDEEHLAIDNPVVTGLALREPHPLPKHLRDTDVELFFSIVSSDRDKAMFILMLRCGLRVQEVANLTLDDVDYRRSQLLIKYGKGAKDRIVYISNDAAEALAVYLQNRPITDERRIFLVEKGRCKGQPLSVRGIQKRIEYYANASGIPVSCHKLRHTMATQLLNADADLVTIQDLLGHNRIKTTMRYCKLSNLKAQRDYYRAVEKVIEKSARQYPATTNTNYADGLADGPFS